MTQKTLLDEFAIAAMQAFMTNQNLLSSMVKTLPKDSNLLYTDTISQISYIVAKAMMQEKKKYDRTANN